MYSVHTFHLSLLPHLLFFVKNTVPISEHDDDDDDDDDDGY
jgi:hypothetical protein